MGLNNNIPFKKIFVGKLQQWLNHKKILSRNSLHYRNMKVAGSLVRCTGMLDRALNDCDAFTMPHICRLVIRNEEHLRNILPNPKNPSYESSLKKLEDMLVIAREYAAL